MLGERGRRPRIGKTRIFAASGIVKLLERLGIVTRTRFHSPRLTRYRNQTHNLKTFALLNCSLPRVITSLDFQSVNLLDTPFGLVQDVRLVALCSSIIADPPKADLPFAQEEVLALTGILPSSLIKDDYIKSVRSAILSTSAHEHQRKWPLSTTSHHIHAMFISTRATSATDTAVCQNMHSRRSRRPTSCPSALEERIALSYCRRRKSPYVCIPGVYFAFTNDDRS